MASPSFLLTDIRIYTGETTIERGSVLVANGKIASVAPSSSKDPTADHPTLASGHHPEVPIISRPGHTLLPGLIDSHIHANGADEAALPQSLRFGVTTVCDMHNEWPNIVKLRKQREGGDCADLKTASWAATIEGGWPMAVVTKFDDSEETMAEIATWPKLVTPEDGRRYVEDRVKEGVDYIKLMHESGTMMGLTLPKPSLALQEAIITAAHAHNLPVVAHATNLADTLEILAAGADGTTHTFLDQPPTPALVAAYQRNNAHCNPTLATLGSLTAEGAATQARFAHDPRVQRLLTPGARERMCACMRFSADAGGKLAHALETVRQLKAAGVPVLAGSDAAGPAVGTAWGLSLHQELGLLVRECGFSPEEALRAATGLPAGRFGFCDRGVVREGLRADLLLVEGNPLVDIGCLLDLRGVWTEGRLCSAFRENFLGRHGGVVRRRGGAVGFFGRAGSVLREFVSRWVYASRRQVRS